MYNYNYIIWNLLSDTYLNFGKVQAIVNYYEGGLKTSVGGMLDKILRFSMSHDLFQDLVPDHSFDMCVSTA